MDCNEREYLWVEKYRPHKVEDCILPVNMKEMFTNMLSSGEMQNMILSGPPGTGKTTVAMAMCDQLGYDFMLLNASMDNGIDILRSRVKDYASTMSLDGKKKVVIFDEADELSRTAQPALRGMIEEFSRSCRFIFTCNFKNKIIDAIHSRTHVVEFIIPNEQKPQLAKDFFVRVCEILDKEGIQYKKETVADLITKHFPDFRATLNSLQSFSVSGVVDDSAVQSTVISDVTPLIGYIKTKQWTEMRKWVATNLDSDVSIVFRKLYDNARSFVEESSIPKLVLILAEYQYKAAFVADSEINTVAAITEIMMSCEFV